MRFTTRYRTVSGDNREGYVSVQRINHAYSHPVEMRFQDGGGTATRITYLDRNTALELAIELIHIFDELKKAGE